SKDGFSQQIESQHGGSLRDHGQTNAIVGKAVADFHFRSERRPYFQQVSAWSRLNHLRDLANRFDNASEHFRQYSRDRQRWKRRVFPNAGAASLKTRKLKKG